MTKLERGGRERQTVLLDSTEDVVDIVGEEPFGIEHGLDQAGNCPQRHVLGMCMPVPLERQDVSIRFPISRRRRKQSHLETLFDLLNKHVTVCSETVHGQDCAIGSFRETRRVKNDIGEEGEVRSETYSLKTFGAYLV